MHVKKLYQAFSTILFMIMALMVPYAQAAQVQLAWTEPTTNANGTPLTDLAGYNLYYGRASRNYGPGIDVGNKNSFTLPNLAEGQTYYFAVTAYDLSGNESGLSNEKSVTIPPADSSDEVVLPVQTVTASAWQAPNIATNTLDSNLLTRWSAEGTGQWIRYDLGTQRTVSQVAIAWYQGNQRRATFAVQVSRDGAAWTEVYRGPSSGTTLAPEAYTFADVPARYVRLVGYGNTANQWNSITEVKVYGP